MNSLFPLSVITPVSRPRNLNIIAESLIKALNYFKQNNTNVDAKVTWYTIFETKTPNAEIDKQKWEEKVLSADYPFNVVIDGVSSPDIKCEEDRPSGGIQRNLAQKLINNSYICCVDDDNIMHEKYISYAYSLISKYQPKKHILSISIRDYPGTPQSGKRSHEDPLQVYWGKVDTRNILYFKDENNPVPDWREKRHDADFYFMKELHNMYKENFVFVPYDHDPQNKDKHCTYYNYIK